MTCRRFSRATTFAFALALISLSAFASAAPPTAKPVTNPQPPALNVTTFKGQSFNLAAQRGKWVLVNLWGSWCVPCITSMPAVSEFVAAHHDVTAIGLDVGDRDHNQLERFLSTHHFNFLLAPVPYSKATEFMVTIPAIPVTWLIGPDGTARVTWYGSFNAAQLAKLMHDAGYRPAP